MRSDKRVDVVEVGEVLTVAKAKGKAALTMKRVKETVGEVVEGDGLGRNPVKSLKFEDSNSTTTKATEQEISRSVGNEEDIQVRLELGEMLKKYFKYAFTIIVKRRKLCPAEAFHTTRAFGVQVPRFSHPSSLEYVEEVAKKVILFTNRGSSEGCAIHVMIEKAKTLHVVQRFVFRTMGSLEAQENESADEDETIDMEEIKMSCRESLLRLLNADTIRPMIAPQFSRWSISIGLKNELAELINLDELWANDPSSNYFPWRKRFRSLASIPRTPSNVSQLELPSSSINGYSESSKDSSDPQSSKEDGDDKMETFSGGSTGSNPNDVAADDDESGKAICFPLSTFKITSNFLISVYGLEYPAPDPPPSNRNGYISSLASPSPRVNRSSSVYSRSAYIRQRLMRHAK